ncbi:hypothetical protein [Acidaminobacter hydrogenoformans]|uniref:hypothetical protein n=1 Tax=Acidaminobacter hydrogenoformans TaxID=65403 RepID=UPI0011142867|nr:hypothetical protein [Acidaminobacter hydrogenoformans]
MSKTVKNLGHMAIGAVTVLALFGAVSVATSGDPGTSTDPVVTRSYVEERLSEIEDAFVKDLNALSDQIEALESSSGSGTTAPAPGAPPAFVVVELEEGSTVVFGENTQVILRGGSATAIAAENDLPDVTGGAGLGMGQKIPLNHLIIIPKDDGRGMKINARTWLMISGKYSVTGPAQ